MDKRFWGILIAIVVVLGGIFWLTKSNSSSSSKVQPTNHVEGQGQDGITLIEYGDYECPFCGQYFPIVRQVQQDYNQKIFFHFRNLPSSQIQKNAFADPRPATQA